MSILGRKVSVKLVAVAALVMVMTIGSLLAAMSRTPAREVVLVARGMAFYLESDPETPNPVIRVKAGEPVRVVLRNEDRGLTHDFAVPALEAALNPIRFGKDASVVIYPPSDPGTYEYACRPHRLMMHGQLVVE